MNISKTRYYYLGFSLIIFFFLSVQSSGAITLASRYLLKDNINGVVGLDYPVAITLSPDNKHLYVAGAHEDAVSVYSRNIDSGALTFVEIHQSGINGVNGMDYPEAITISPDGDYLYIAGVNDGTVTIFKRDSATGRVIYVGSQFDGLGGARDITISPDGKHIYVAGSDKDIVAVFSRDSDSGLMSFIEKQEDDIGNVDGLNGVISMCISPDGKHLYTTGWWDNAVTVFERDSQSGALTFIEVYIDNVSGIDGLESPIDVKVSSDGKHVYVVGVNDDAIAVFSRNSTSGILTFVEVKKDRVGDVNGLDGAIAMSIDPAGDYVYVAGALADSVVIFSRDVDSGALTYIEAQSSLIGGVQGLTGTRSVTVSADGNFVYVARPDADALSVLVKNYSQADWRAEQKKWDVGLDGQIGLGEAIRALQITTDEGSE